MASLVQLENRIQALENIILNAIVLPKDVLDVSDTSVTDKTGRFVMGSGIAGINNGGAFWGKSTVSNPTLDTHLTDKFYT